MANVVRRLRNKIWIILTSSFYGLILTIITILFLLSDQRAQEAIYGTVYTSLLSEKLYFSNVFFSIEINEKNEIYQIHSDFNMMNSEYKQIITKVLQNDRDHNIFELENGTTWMYAFAPMRDIFRYIGEGYRRVIFVLITGMQLRHIEFTKTLVAIAIGSFILVFSGSFFAARYFVKSTKSSFEAQVVMTQQQKKFTANATHELRTPIAMISGSYAEILRNRNQTVESQIEWFNIIDFATKRMNSLTNELLMLAKLEGRVVELEKNQLNVSEIVKSTVDTMNILATEKGIKIQKGIANKIYLFANEEKFVQLLIILLENAIKYTNDFGEINVDVWREENEVKIKIENSGAGIAAQNIPHLFDRFYRVDNKNKFGTGLGLTIAKEIVQQLGGAISVASVIDKSTTFILTFE